MDLNFTRVDDAKAAELAPQFNAEAIVGKIPLPRPKPSTPAAEPQYTPEPTPEAPQGRLTEGNVPEGSVEHLNPVGLLSRISNLLTGEKLPNREYGPTKKGFPTEEEVDFARKSGFTYGKTYEKMFNNEAVTVAGRTPLSNATSEEFKPFIISWDKLDSLKEQVGEGSIEAFKAEAKNLHARTVLALETSSALGTLGYLKTFKKAGIDPNNLGETNIGGMYNRKKREIWVNPFYTTTLAHESLHAGINELKDTKYWKPEFDKFEKSGKLQELLVRFAMKSMLGVDEEYKPLVEASTKFFGNEEERRIFNDIEKAAAQYLADQDPMGPR